MTVNSVSAVSDALKYINGVDVNEEETNIVSDCASSIFNPLTAIFGGMEVNSSLKTALGTSSIKETISAIKSGEYTLGESVLKSTSISEQWKNTISNILKKAEAKSADSASTALTTVAENADDAAAAASKTGLFSKIGGYLTSAKGLVKSGLSKVGSKLASTSIGKTISSGVSSLLSTSAGKTIASAGSKVSKVLKGTGAVGMMVMEGVLGIATEVIPAFAQGGVVSGVKQLGKTAVKTLGTGLGWAGGQAAATAIGAAIGSVFPGVGTVIGGAIGTFVGGIIGSTIGNKIASKITGKSEVEKLQEEQYEEAAQQVIADSSAMEELNSLVSAQVQSEIANGTADEDTETMALYLNSGAFSTTTSTTGGTTYSTSTTSDTQSSTGGLSTSDLEELVQKIEAGDTSIYDISDEQLASVFSDSSTSTSSSSATSTEDEIINYFAMD